MKASWAALATLAALGFSTLVYSEPWMASRYAQNCAACHAPGRVNVPAKERRCSLSCQGCHTNPSGGGLRNTYGKWTEERWLRSAYLSNYKMNKPRPQPTDQQYYAEKRLRGYMQNMNETDQKRTYREGFKLRETLKELSEADYDRRSTGEKVLIPDLKDAQLRIPEDDPWRQRRMNYFNAGLDFRWFYLDTKADDVHEKGTMPMATDIAVSVEPVHKVTLVYESRTLSDPQQITVWDQHYTSASQIRSAYVLVDDLAYNTFVQYGIYRPMFGQYNPDHTTLFALATGLDMRSRFKALSVGTAPNVPFFNVHYIMPFEGQGITPKQKGFAMNAGARFVTLGAYAMFSYWNTAEAQTAGPDLKRSMTSITGGFTKAGLTMVADFTRVQHEQGGAKDAGNVITLEPRYRLYKENYLKFSYEMMNTGPDLYVGKASQMGFGVDMFVISGVELDFMIKKLNYTQTDRTTGVASDHKTDAMWFQTHFFF